MEEAPRANQKLDSPPAELSALIELAVNDGNAILKDERYEPNAHIYHRVMESERDGDERCHVCDAGAIMAARLGADINENLDPHVFGEWAGALYAIDHVRRGEIGEAAEIMERRQLDPGIHRKLEAIHTDHSDFTSRATFRAHLRSLKQTAQAIEALGL